MGGSCHSFLFLCFRVAGFRVTGLRVWDCRNKTTLGGLLPLCFSCVSFFVLISDSHRGGILPFVIFFAFFVLF